MPLIADVGDKVEERLDFSLLEGFLFTGDIRHHHFVNIAEQCQGVLGLQNDPLVDEFIGLPVFLNELIMSADIRLLQFKSLCNLFLHVDFLLHDIMI